MSEKALRKQMSRCLKWLQRLAELYAANEDAKDVSLVVSQQATERATEVGFLVLNGGVLAGYTPYGILTALSANELLTPKAPQRVLFYGPTLPFVLVKQPLVLPERSATDTSDSSVPQSALSLLSIPPGRSWFTGECLVLSVPQADALWRAGSSRSAGCGFLFLVPCDFVALYTAFAARIQRHALGFPTSMVRSPSVPGAPRELYCTEVEGVPGLLVVPDFISEDEECAILSELDAHRDALKVEYLARRRVAHFNRRFIYGANNLGPVGEDVNTEPRFYQWMRARLNNTDPSVRIDGPYPVSPVGSWACDQLTANYYDYQDGHTPGIATHVDAHSPFEECVFVVSLGSYTVMDFCRWDAPADVAPPVPVFMAPRSLVVLSGEARYGWTHCIAERRTDIVNEYTDVLVRRDRVSLTWRSGKDTVHLKSTCAYPSLCDGA